MTHVSLRKINKIYRTGARRVHAVQDLDLEIADGEFIALLGPSGCGKTSTLRMIVGLEAITSGDIYFGDTRVNDLDPQSRNVAMAFETYALYPNFTVEENLAFPLEVRGFGLPERRKRAREVAEMLRIASLLNEKPPSLSGGQQQRVSLGRALIRDPAVFILDEVMSHLDAHLKFQMLLDLKRLHRALKRTMIYVTHDQVEALALADRVAVMSEFPAAAGRHPQRAVQPAGQRVRRRFHRRAADQPVRGEARGQPAAGPLCRSPAPTFPSRSRRSGRGPSPIFPRRRSFSASARRTCTWPTAPPASTPRC